MRTCIAAFLSVPMLLGVAAGAAAEECPDNPEAIGTSRTMAVKPDEFPLVGKEQYRETLRLENREVVLTFNDGPVAPYTHKVLETLAAECVKATFFLLGANVAEVPDLARRAVSDGHTVGTLAFSDEPLGNMPHAAAIREIDKGIAAALKALGNPHDLAPFFRAPYLETTPAIEMHLYSRGIMIWSFDVAADDWTEITEERMVELVMKRLGEAGKGIILLHDIQPVTARALRMLLAELKRQNYRIVHVVPASASPPRPLPKSTSFMR